MVRLATIESIVHCEHIKIEIARLLKLTIDSRSTPTLISVGSIGYLTAQYHNYRIHY